MDIIILTNSVGTRNVPNPNVIDNCGYPIFPDIIGAKYYYHFLITGALWRLRTLNISKDDIIIVNIGINDCIFRKDNVVQINGFEAIYKESKDNGDLVSIKLIEDAMNYLKIKSPEAIFQLLNFKNFEKCVDILFNMIHKGIVISILYCDPKSPIVGYGYNEFVKVNKILERNAKKYGLEYLDLFDTPNLTFDDVHLTKEGHKYVAQKLKEIISARFK